MSEMSDEKTPKKKKFNIDRLWVIDKVIELSIFVLGFLIALWIDGVRADNDVKQLKEHYMEVVQTDLRKDLESYEFSYHHDSLRAEGCDYILGWLLKRQNSEFHSYGTPKHSTEGRIGPGFDFDEGGFFDEVDTLEIVAEKNGWFLDSSGYWINKQIVRSVNNEFNWFSSQITDSVKSKIEKYAWYVDETKSVFQHTTGYEGLISQNTSSFLNTTEIESKLSDYYSFGSYLNWLENYYRDNHYVKYNELRYAYGPKDLFKFLYLLTNEQNNLLIQQLTLASIHAKKEKTYYLKAIEMNKNLADYIANSEF